MHGTITIKPGRQTESNDGEMSGEHLGTLLRQVSKTSIGEIDSLIVELKTLHKKLQTDGDRIQRDIAEHAELSQQVMQLTKIISDSVKKTSRTRRVECRENSVVKAAHRKPDCLRPRLARPARWVATVASATQQRRIPPNPLSLAQNAFKRSFEFSCKATPAIALVAGQFAC